MKATTYSDCQQSFRAWVDFSQEEDVEADSFILPSALGKIAESALELLQANPSAENKAVFWEYQRRNEALLQSSGDLYFLYISKFFTGMHPPDFSILIPAYSSQDRRWVKPGHVPFMATISHNPPPIIEVISYSTGSQNQSK